LSAKVLNPDIFIVARSDDENSISKLKRAGADRVVNPYAIGGQRLANLIINTNVVDFIDTSFGSIDNNLSIENIKITDKSNIANKTLRELEIRKKSGATILAIIRNEKPILNPDADFKIESEDRLLAFGNSEQLKILERMTMK
jgi:voltage-gated potassium channel